MDRTATPNKRTAMVERGFERSRLSEEVLASAYERLTPIVRRVAGLLPHKGTKGSGVEWHLNFL